jgi:hypothetical protein
VIIRRYLSNLFDNQNPDDLKRYATYMVNRWNKAHGPERKVADVSIVFMRVETQPDLTVNPAVKDTLYFQSF